MIKTQTLTIENIYKEKKRKILSSLGYPIGEIIATFHPISDDTLKLLDSNNILLKASYPELYEVIGDMYTEYYTNKYTLGEIPLANPETEFMVPDLSGLYLVQKDEFDEFTETEAAFQSFKIKLSNNLATTATFSSFTNKLKSNREDNLTVNTTKKPIKNIRVINIEEKRYQNAVGIHIDDKCALFYMRVK